MIALHQWRRACGENHERYPWLRLLRVEERLAEVREEGEGVHRMTPKNLSASRDVRRCGRWMAGQENENETAIVRLQVQILHFCRRILLSAMNFHAPLCQCQCLLPQPHPDVHLVLQKIPGSNGTYPDGCMNCISFLLTCWCGEATGIVWRLELDCREFLQFEPGREWRQRKCASGASLTLSTLSPNGKRWIVTCQ